MSGPPVRIWSGPVRGPEFRTNLILVRSGGPEFRTKLYWSGPMVRNSGPSQIGPVRWSGIPDQFILVRSGGPEFRTKLYWSGPEIFLILKLKKNENPCD